jgi:hypothetical protein
MNESTEIIPIGHFPATADKAIQTTVELGQLALTQLDVAGLGSTGNRFIVELEQGKPTLQLQKVLDVLNSLGLEVVIRAKAGASL